MSIKDSTEDWVRKSPGLALTVFAVIGLLIGGAIGLGAGWKIEQNRTKDDVARLQKELRASAAPGQITGSGPLGQRVGKVTAVKPGSITVATKKGGSQVVVTTAATSIDKAVKGTTADIVAGRRVLVTPGGREFVVLSKDSKLGRPVSTVASDSITVASVKSGGPAAKIKIADVKVVSTVKPGKSADVKSGAVLIAGGKAASDKNFNAVEVIVLPSGSGFAN